MKNTKMDGKSINPQEELLELLKQKFPEVFSEGFVDCQKLKQTLGEDVDLENERYGMTWAGKNNCFRVIQEPTTATLKPTRDESVDFDKTENLFIEGDNLEILKILQKPYYGKVKMIYIDPPYNTGGDFIYNDNFRQDKAEYDEKAGIKDGNGDLRGDGLMKNTKDRGHYHSDWLNMMYPRLFLARNLLRQDGVIFVSIDDNEVKNLRMVMDEIFGEDNFEGHIHWRRRHNQPNDPKKLVALVAEHILVYAKNKEVLKKSGVGKLELTGKFSNPDNDERGVWNSKPWKVGSNQTGSRYKITLPNGEIADEEWMGDKSTFNTLLKDNRIYFPKNGGGLPRKKIFKSERETEGQSATNWFEHSLFGHNQEASMECAELFDGNKNIFDNPKPIKLLKKLTMLGNVSDGELILDFFAGSGTTAHAVMALNAEDGGARKFIQVQLPELCDEKSEACKAGYKTIADISKERIRRAGKKIKDEKEKQLNLDGGKLDTGFKVFKLDDSNFKIWRTDVKDEKALIEQMNIFVDNVKEESTQDNILYELILKSGLNLNVDIAKKEADKKTYFLVDEGKLVICLENKITQALIDAILADKPEKIICLDKAFGGNDQLKTNTLLQVESAKIDFKVI